MVGQMVDTKRLAARGGLSDTTKKPLPLCLPLLYVEGEMGGEVSDISSVKWSQDKDLLQIPEHI